MTIEQLNAEFGLADQLGFESGKNDFPFITIENEYATAVISVYAGQVLSFIPKHAAQDVLFLSESAYYKEGKAIKGGVPICWPWFGADPEGLGRPGHGFIRNRMWSVLATKTTEQGETQVVLGLEHTPEIQEIWPQAFKLMLEITIGKSLQLDLITENKGDTAFTITQALHTYFSVGDINQTQVLGLEGKQYIDKTDGAALKEQSGEVIIEGEVDRVYTDTANELVIADKAFDRKIVIKSEGSQTTVVWNPWEDIAANMADLGDEDFQYMLCVETANAANDVIEIPAGGQHRLVAEYSIESL